MITKNYKKIVESILSTGNNPSANSLISVSGDVCISAPALIFNDPIYKLTPLGMNAGSFLHQNHTNIAADSTFIILGKENTPATENDYALASPLSENEISAFSKATTKTADGLLITLTYTGSSIITLGEIGIIAGFAYSGNSSSNRKYILLDRSPFPNKITLNTNDVVQILYSFNVTF